MSNVRHNITNKTARRTNETLDYLEDSERHPRITVGKAEYFSRTPGRGFLRTLSRIRTAYRALNQMQPRPKARNLTEWVIVRQSHKITLNEKQWEQLNETFGATMRPGIIAKFVTPTPASKTTTST